MLIYRGLKSVTNLLNMFPSQRQGAMTIDEDHQITQYPVRIRSGRNQT